LYVDEPLKATVDDLTEKRLDLKAARMGFGQSRNFVAAFEPFDLEHIGDGLITIGEHNTSNDKAGPFLCRMHLAVTGQKVSPPLFESMLAMGKERVLDRLDQAALILGRN
jgi:glutamyl-tRNA synthetase